MLLFMPESESHRLVDDDYYAVPLTHSLKRILNLV